MDKNMANKWKGDGDKKATKATDFSGCTAGPVLGIIAGMLQPVHSTLGAGTDSSFRRRAAAYLFD